VSEARGQAPFDLAALSLVSLVCGRIAHDLNNVLAAIDGYSEFVAQEVKDRPQALADITEVRDAAKKGAAFSRRLRQVGQLVEGSPEPVDLSELVTDAQEQLQISAGDHCQVKLSLAQGLRPVSADRRQLQLALLSLVDNACEAMPDGGTMELKTFASGDNVALRVSDTGVGMPADMLERVYEPFFSTKPKAIGNGLGLFIVDGVVRRAGGLAEISSRQGGGTSVTLLLPAG
jgi:signal transduction histidine kinase